ncbi:MAG TPA: ATP-binding protein, partial [bacterium]|nr:ATP-binding protein [bacterium]
PAWLSEFARQPDVRYVQRKAGGVMQEQYGKEEAVPAEEVFAVESPLPDHPRESLTVGFDNHPIRENDRILFQRMLLSVGVMGFLAFIMLVWIRLQKNYAFQSRLLRQVQSYHRTVLDTMRDAVLAWEPAGSMTFWNPRAQKLFPVLASLPLQGTLPGSIQALRERVREHPREDTVDLQEEERGLRRFRVEETYIPEPMPTRVLFLTDVTDVENATREQDRREYWETLAQIASGVAHEVRNPLNAIDMTIQTICMEPSTLNAGDRETLESVRGEIRRINAMVEHFLAYGRPRPPVFAEMDLNAVARDVAQFLAPLLQEKNLRITLEAAPLPGIQADAQQIKQALLNIALNAIDASPPGTELSFQTSIAEDGVFFRCRDHGQGMTPDQVQKIFDPYVTFKPGGTGLGLSIVKRILDSHGGTIQITSQPEAGTTVT